MGNCINFITAADNKYFTRVCGLIGSIIQKSVSDYTIHVYDLGLLPEQIRFINSIPLVTVRKVEQQVPHIIKHMRAHMEGGPDTVPGLYSWKPVIISQALQEFETVFYLDAGVIITKDVWPIVQRTKEKGYFFIKTHSVGWMATQYVSRALHLTVEELYTPGINAGIQCLDRKVWNSYVVPVAEFVYNIELFKDDGTAIGGPISGRHDQALFSIQAARANLSPYPGSFRFNNQDRNFNIVDMPDQITERTLIYHCRGNSDYQGDLTFIKNKYGHAIFKG